MQPELRTRCHAAKPHGSLEFDGGASLFELSLGLLGVFLLGVLENRLRSAVDEGLGLGQTEVGDGANSLDDLDLLVTNGGEDDGELILLFLGRAAPGAAAATAATGAAASTSNFSSKALTKSDSSTRVISPKASRSSSWVNLAIMASFQSWR